MLHCRLQLQQHHLSWSSTRTALKVHVWIWFVPVLFQCYCWPLRSGCATRYLCVPFLEPPEPSADVSVDISSSHASVGASSLPRTVLPPCPCCLPLSCGGSPWGSCWFCLAPTVVQGGCCVKSKCRGAFCLFGGELRCVCRVCLGTAGALGSVCYLHPARDGLCPSTHPAGAENTFSLSWSVIR